ncbi:uncharacterized protein BDZ99DRAFT_527301 [Mytilinidion resinicola]|uniref:Uncharacterized protein n=1 Tax=Mytilinidion resinicola TaxID=574789 RepID=A0A6A6Y3H4_9PEZI|nr:uncharacterized protein BDZ99DRAFT_527301 [Mytilinidion resinicola]KAF2802574.1 hypothetical protein BDZ99DRAFT_527301 [Mytilinidion resinicola]
MDSAGPGPPTTSHRRSRQPTAPSNAVAMEPNNPDPATQGIDRARPTMPASKSKVPQPTELGVAGIVAAYMPSQLQLLQRGVGLKRDTRKLKDGKIHLPLGGNPDFVSLVNDIRTAFSEVYSYLAERDRNIRTLQMLFTKSSAAVNRVDGRVTSLKGSVKRTPRFASNECRSLFESMIKEALASFQPDTQTVLLQKSELELLYDRIEKLEKRSRNLEHCVKCCDNGLAHRTEQKHSSEKDESFHQSQRSQPESDPGYHSEFMTPSLKFESKEMQSVKYNVPEHDNDLLDDSKDSVAVDMTSQLSDTPTVYTLTAFQPDAVASDASDASSDQDDPTFNIGEITFSHENRVPHSLDDAALALSSAQLPDSASVDSKSPSQLDDSTSDSTTQIDHSNSDRERNAEQAEISDLAQNVVEAERSHGQVFTPDTEATPNEDKENSGNLFDDSEVVSSDTPSVTDLVTPVPTLMLGDDSSITAMQIDTPGEETNSTSSSDQSSGSLGVQASTPEGHVANGSPDAKTEIQTQENVVELSNDNGFIQAKTDSNDALTALLDENATGPSDSPTLLSHETISLEATVDDEVLETQVGSAQHSAGEKTIEGLDDAEGDDKPHDEDSDDSDDESDGRDDGAERSRVAQGVVNTHSEAELIPEAQESNSAADAEEPSDHDALTSTSDISNLDSIIAEFSEAPLSGSAALPAASATTSEPSAVYQGLTEPEAAGSGIASNNSEDGVDRSDHGQGGAEASGGSQRNDEDDTLRSEGASPDVPLNRTTEPTSNPKASDSTLRTTGSANDSTLSSAPHMAVKPGSALPFSGLTPQSASRTPSRGLVLAPGRFVFNHSPKSDITEQAMDFQPAVPEAPPTSPVTGQGLLGTAPESDAKRGVDAFDAEMEDVSGDTSADQLDGRAAAAVKPNPVAQDDLETGNVDMKDETQDSDGDEEIGDDANSSRGGVPAPSPPQAPQLSAQPSLPSGLFLADATLREYVDGRQKSLKDVYDEMLKVGIALNAGLSDEDFVRLARGMEFKIARGHGSSFPRYREEIGKLLAQIRMVRSRNLWNLYLGGWRQSVKNLPASRPPPTAMDVTTQSAPNPQASSSSNNMPQPSSLSGTQPRLPPQLQPFQATSTMTTSDSRTPKPSSFEVQKEQHARQQNVQVSTRPLVDPKPSTGTPRPTHTGNQHRERQIIPTFAHAQPTFHREASMGAPRSKQAELQHRGTQVVLASAPQNGPRRPLPNLPEGLRPVFLERNPYHPNDPAKEHAYSIWLDKSRLDNLAKLYDRLQYKNHERLFQGAPLFTVDDIVTRAVKAEERSIRYWAGLDYVFRRNDALYMERMRIEDENGRIEIGTAQMRQFRQDLAAQEKAEALAEEERMQKLRIQVKVMDADFQRRWKLAEPQLARDLAADKAYRAKKAQELEEDWRRKMEVKERANEEMRKALSEAARFIALTKAKEAQAEADRAGLEYQKWQAAMMELENQEKAAREAALLDGATPSVRDTLAERARERDLQAASARRRPDEEDSPTEEEGGPSEMRALTAAPENNTASTNGVFSVPGDDGWDDDDSDDGWGGDDGAELAFNQTLGDSKKRGR